VNGYPADGERAATAARPHWLAFLAPESKHRPYQHRPYHHRLEYRLRVWTGPRPQDARDYTLPDRQTYHRIRGGECPGCVTRHPGITRDTSKTCLRCAVRLARAAQANR
jgi:hypothetical protein